MTNDKLFERVQLDAFYDEMNKIAAEGKQSFADKVLLGTGTKLLQGAWGLAKKTPALASTALKHPALTVGALYMGGKALGGARTLVGSSGQQMNNPDLVSREPSFVFNQRKSWR